MTADGHDAKAMAVGDATALQQYAAVVVGTPIYFGRPLPEAIRFVRDNSNWLATRSLGLFTVGITLNIQAGREFTDAALAEMASQSRHSSPKLASFGGTIRLSKMSFLKRFVLSKGFSMADEDHRNPKEVEDWARRLAKSVSET